ncbi:MAG: NADPH-dependent FMN reductase, partial [Nesterenkonia sp.]
MVKIGYIVGSLAADSLNRKLAGVLVAQAPEGVQMVEVPIAELPLYDRHLDEDFPQVLTDFKAQVDDVDALLLVTPEHNQSYPAPV